MKEKDQQEKVIYYKVIASGYKDYVKVMLCDTEIIYVRTNVNNFAFIKQEITLMVDALNIAPTLVAALKSVRGIEAWIPTSERHLTKRVYLAIDEYEKTFLAEYFSNGIKKTE